MRKNEAKSLLFTDGRFLIRENSRFHHKTNTNKLTQQSLNTLMGIKYKQFYMPTENYLKNITYNNYKKENLIKEIKYFHNENYKTFVKDIKKDINNENIFLTYELKN